MKLPSSKSLHFRFSTWILLGVIIPALGGITWASFYASNIISKKIAKTLKSEAKILKSEVNQWLEANNSIENQSNLNKLVEDTDIDTSYSLILDDSNQLIASDSAISSKIDLQEISSYLSEREMNVENEDYLVFEDKTGTKWIYNEAILNNGWSVIALQEASEAFSPIKQLWLRTSEIAIIIAILTVIILQLITKHVLKPLQIMTVVANQISQGNLKYRIPITSQDELGTVADALNVVIEKLEKTTIELQTQQENQIKQLEEKTVVASPVIEEKTNEVAATDNKTLENFNQAISQIENIVAAINNTANCNQEEVTQLSTNTVEQKEIITAALEKAKNIAKSMTSVAQSANKAEKSIKEATEKVKQEDSTINATVERIVSLGESTAAAKDQVQKLSKASRKISKAVDLIRKIALQTNVLAVNASIEAARAGEEGMGFTVVAEEVQSLATRSAKTATDIEKLVLEIQGETNKVIKVIDQSNQEIVAGSNLMLKTRESLQEVTNASMEIDRLIEDISKLAAEQSENSENVTSTIQTAAAIANKTSESAVDVSNSFRELQQVTKQLETQVSQFKEVENQI